MKFDKLKKTGNLFNLMYPLKSFSIGHVPLTQNGDVIDRKRARVTTVFMDLQGCVATIVQQSFFLSDITPRVSLLTLSLSVLVLVDDTSCPAHCRPLSTNRFAVIQN